MAKNTNNNKDKYAAKSTDRNAGKHMEGVNIDFLSKANIFAGLSILLVLVSLVLIFSKGLNYGIDFAGGTEVQVLFD